MRRMVLTLTAIMALLGLSLWAQTAAKNPEPAKPATPTLEAPSNLNQLMQGIIYPEANVVFSSQNDNPADAKPPRGQDPALATDPLVSTFGGWKAVENAALALRESANLLLIPERKCANGLPVPMNDPDWQKFVQQLRDAGTKAYQAAQTKNQDNMIEASDALNAVCTNCHRKWREKALADRCK